MNAVTLTWNRSSGTSSGIAMYSRSGFGGGATVVLKFIVLMMTARGEELSIMFLAPTCAGLVFSKVSSHAAEGL